MIQSTRAVTLLLLIAVASGCGHGVMHPGAQARVVAGEPQAAYSVVEGVRCSADVGAWRSKVDDLPGDVVPIRVWIKTGAGTPSGCSPRTS